MNPNSRFISANHDTNSSSFKGTERESEDDSVSFANIFTDEVELGTIGGFLSQNKDGKGQHLSSSITSSYKPLLPNIGNHESKQYSQHQQQLSTHEQSCLPSLPLHFDESISSTNLSETNASTFLRPDEVTTISTTTSIVSDKVSRTPSQSNLKRRRDIGGMPLHEQIPEIRRDITSVMNESTSDVFNSQYAIHIHGNLDDFTSRTQSRPLEKNIPNTIITSSENQFSTSAVEGHYEASNLKNTLPEDYRICKRGGKRFKSLPPQISEDEAEELRRRRKQERNIREQQRSQRIAAQILDLKKTLTDTANIKFRKTDKYSILNKAVDYIRQLQRECVTLDTNHKKLVETISQTSEIVHSSNGLGSQLNKTLEASHSSQAKQTSSETTLVQSNSTSADNYIIEASEFPFFNSMALFDYKTVFGNCSAALGVFGLDGTLLNFNLQFEILTGCSCTGTSSRGSKTPKDAITIFHLCKDSKEIAEICSAMETMISEETKKLSFWSGQVRTIKEPYQTLLMNLTLARNKERHPKFYNCVLFEDS